MNISFLRLLTVLAFLGGTYILLQGVSGTHRVPIKKPLVKFPAMLGSWHVLSSRESTAVEVKMLGVDDYIEFNYSTSKNQPINFYVAYYESVGIGGGYHSPKSCLPGGGWGIEAEKTTQVQLRDGQAPVTVSELIIRNRNEYQVVLYWYQNRGRIIHSEYWEKIYLVLDAIMKKRRDGAFVRLMVTVSNGDIQQAEKVLEQFAVLALSELDNFLPGE